MNLFYALVIFSLLLYDPSIFNLNLLRNFLKAFSSKYGLQNKIGNILSLMALAVV